MLGPVYVSKRVCGVPHLPTRSVASPLYTDLIGRCKAPQTPEMCGGSVGRDQLHQVSFLFLFLPLFCFL
jgi:hypothetical protein